MMRVFMNKTIDVRAGTYDTINYILQKYGSLFSDDTVDAVKNYCSVDEYEMAFEGLMLDSIENGISYDEDTMCKIYYLAKALNLNKESIFDADFWQKFTTYLNGNGFNTDKNL